MYARLLAAVAGSFCRHTPSAPAVAVYVPTLSNFVVTVAPGFVCPQITACCGARCSTMWSPSVYETKPRRSGGGGRARLTHPSEEFLHAFALPTQQPATFCFASQPRPSGSHQFHVSQCASPTHAAQHSAEVFAAFLPRPWHCVSPRSSGKAAAAQAEVRKASMEVSEVKR